MKILIFEDEYPIAISLQNDLNSLGYKNIHIAHDLEKAYQIIDEGIPDIAILDINIPTDKEGGIKVGKYLNRSNDSTIIIFMTINSDELIIEKALGTKPHNYLSKAFNKRIILYSIEKAIENFADKKQAESNKTTLGSSHMFKQYIMFKKNNGIFYKVEKKDILYVHSESGVITINTELRQYYYSSTLSVFLSQINESNFIKVGRNYIINILHFDAFLGSNYIQVKNRKLQLSSSEYKNLFNLFEIFRTKKSAT